MLAKQFRKRIHGMDKAKRQCFVLMPFADQYREVHEQIYKVVCSDNNVDCWRVDEVARPGSITKDIVDGIIDSDIIIADLTSQNPNVFYELGIAHSVGNKTIMTSQNIDDVPFDIGNYRVILYEQTISGSKEFLKKLDKAIKELLKSLDQTNNPVQEVLANRAAVGRRRRVPLFKLVDPKSLNPSLRELLDKEGIIYTDQIEALDLSAIKDKYSLGKASLEKLVQAMLSHDLYGDIEKLHRFILDNKLSTIGKKRWY